jgi:hypothetical protein
MTPFLYDLGKIYFNIRECLICIFCYFFGHKYGEWKSYDGHSKGCLRICKRCFNYEHDPDGSIGSL